MTATVEVTGRPVDVLRYIDANWIRPAVSYPFPVDRDGFMGRLHLPVDGLNREEAERLKAYIDALVTEGLE